LISVKQGVKVSKLCLALVAILVLAACSGKADQATKESPHAMKSESGGMPTAAASCQPSGTALTLAAKDIKFDKDCLAAPAGQAFTIAFNNMEAVPHNVGILESHGSTNELFAAQAPFTGPGTVTYQVPALKAGTFHFHCAVHPELMKGTFVVK